MQRIKKSNSFGIGIPSIWRNFLLLPPLHIYSMSFQILTISTFITLTLMKGIWSEVIREINLNNIRKTKNPLQIWRSKIVQRIKISHHKKQSQKLWHKFYFNNNVLNQPMIKNPPRDWFLLSDKKLIRTLSYRIVTVLTHVKSKEWPTYYLSLK